jgi:hypothetical protein
MKNKLRSLYFLIVVATLGTISGCVKETDMVVPASKALFLPTTAGNYTIASPTTTFKIPVGITAPSSTPTVINVSVSSTTGAQAGVHYNLSSNSVTIPAGKVVDTIIVTGVYNQYLAGRKDVLVFRISEEQTSSGLRNSYTLNMRGPCFEGDVTLSTLQGDYNNSTQSWFSGGGPYKTTVTAVNSISATSGTITVSGIKVIDPDGDITLSRPLTFLLDWTDPANRTVVLSPSPEYDLGLFPAAWGFDPGDQLAVTNSTVTQGPGTFSVCSATITLRMRIGLRGPSYPNGAFYGQLYTLQMAR